MLENFAKRMAFLQPDKNRPSLESVLSRQLAEGFFPNSLSSTHENPWQKGQTSRVMLIVPPYTRLIRSLDVIAKTIAREQQDARAYAEDQQILTTFQHAGITSLEEMKRAGIPMGLLRVGTAAKKAEYNVKIVDAVFEGWDHEYHYFDTSEGSSVSRYGLTDQQIFDRVQDFQPHIVGISIDYTHQWGNARHVADLVKRINPQIITIMGGTHAHGLPEDVLLDSPTDYVVFGPADETFVVLLDILTGKKKKHVEEIPGIAYRSRGEIIRTKRQAFPRSIDAIAIPDLSLIDLSLYGKKYHSAGERVRDDGHLLYGFTTVGCNTRCTFCAIPPVQGAWRAMNETTFDEYLQYITSQGVTEFIVEDDHLFHDPEWALYVFRKLREYELPWVEEGGVGLFTLIALLPEISEEYIRASIEGSPSVFQKTIEAKRKGITAELLIRAMAESGCHSLYLAVESANGTSLGTSHKPILNAQELYTRQVVSLFAKYGIKTTCGVMLGFLNSESKSIYVESHENIQRTVAYGKMLREAGAAYINPFIFTPLPGAPHFDDLKRYVIRNTDEGFSHEFGTITAPNGLWTRDEMSLLRSYAIVQTIGMEGYKQILETGTWPVGR